MEYTHIYRDKCCHLYSEYGYGTYTRHTSSAFRSANTTSVLSASVGLLHEMILQYTLKCPTQKRVNAMPYNVGQSLFLNKRPPFRCGVIIQLIYQIKFAYLCASNVSRNFLTVNLRQLFVESRHSALYCVSSLPTHAVSSLCLYTFNGPRR